jgi:hypothetical protein
MSWTADFSRDVPNPFRSGLTTLGLFLSSHLKYRLRILPFCLVDQLTLTEPLIFDNAAYFTALVVSSWTIMEKLLALCQQARQLRNVHGNAPCLIDSRLSL